MDKERDGCGSSYHQERSRKNPALSVSWLLISYFVTATLQVSHPPVGDAQEIIAGDGAADKPVLYYNTNHNSCFTTPVVGFKECLGDPAPVLVQRWQSSSGTGVAEALPAWAPGALGHPQPPCIPDWRIFAELLQAEDHIRAG